MVGVDHVDRKTDGPSLIGERAADRVTDPPTRVRREPETTTIVVALDGLHEANVPLLDEVCERKTAMVEPSSDRDHQAQISLHELVLRRLEPEGEAGNGPDVIPESLGRRRERNSPLEGEALRGATDPLDLSQCRVQIDTIDVDGSKLGGE